MHIYPRLSKARVRSRRAAETFERLASCGVHEIRAILYRDRCLHSTSVRDYSQLILHFRGRRGGDHPVCLKCIALSHVDQDPIQEADAGHCRMVVALRADKRKSDVILTDPRKVDLVLPTAASVSFPEAGLLLEEQRGGQHFEE